MKHLTREDVRKYATDDEKKILKEVMDFDDSYRTSEDDLCYHCEFCDNCLTQDLNMQDDCPIYQETKAEYES